MLNLLFVWRKKEALVEFIRQLLLHLLVEGESFTELLLGSEDVA